MEEIRKPALVIALFIAMAYVFNVAADDANSTEERIAAGIFTAILVLAFVWSIYGDGFGELLTRYVGAVSVIILKTVVFLIILTLCLWLVFSGAIVSIILFVVAVLIAIWMFALIFRR